MMQNCWSVVFSAYLLEVQCICNQIIIINICRNLNPIPFSFMTYHRVCKKSSTKGATCRAGTAFPSRASLFIPGFSGVRVAQYLISVSCFVDFCPFSFGHCIVCLSINDF